MKAVLITLSGDPDIGLRYLNKRFADSNVEQIPRSLIENGSMRKRLSAVRRLRPDIFCVMTEAVNWQYGQDALMLLGALSGARESLIIDARGSVRSGKRLNLLMFGPLRIGLDVVKGLLAVRRAIKKLALLERQIDIVNETTHRQPSARSAKRTIEYLRTVPAAGTLPGGAASHINGVVNALVQLGGNLNFIANDEVTGLDRSRIAFHKINTETDVMPRAAFDIYNGMRFSEAAMDIISADHPDFVYQRYSRFSYAGVEASAKAKVPLFLEYNGSEVWLAKHWDRKERIDLLDRYERLNLAAAARIFVVSEVEKGNLLNAGIASDKIVLNPNGVDTEKFCPGVGGEEQRKRLGLTADAVVVGFVGTFGPWHGVLELAEAITAMPKDTTLHFLFVGDGNLRAEVEERLRKADVLDRVAFTGTVSHDRVPALLDACDILVSPHVPLAGGAEFFGSPTKLFEYMSMGKGIVASRLGQIGDVLVDHETALLVAAADPRQLSEAILELAADEPLRRNLGTKARVEAERNHSWAENARRVLQTFEEMNS
jgi:glycosyltransferase involved in cell wall biosynthesis